MGSHQTASPGALVRVTEVEGEIYIIRWHNFILGSFKIITELFFSLTMGTAKHLLASFVGATADTIITVVLVSLLGRQASLKYVGNHNNLQTGAVSRTLLYLLEHVNSLLNYTLAATNAQYTFNTFPSHHQSWITNHELA